MRHAIIIRCHYEPGDLRFAWRFAFFQSMVLPRLMKQTRGGFDIWIRCHPKHNESFYTLGPRIYPFQGHGIEDDLVGISSSPQYFTNDLPRYHIQTRLDSDDLIGLKFVSRIRAEVMRHPDKPMIINFQPWKLDLMTLTRYRAAWRYGPQSTSMFLSLYQPDLEKEPYWHIYDYHHGQIASELPENVRVVTIPEGYCDLVVHHDNFSTSLGAGDCPINGG